MATPSPAPRAPPLGLTSLVGTGLRLRVALRAGKLADSDLWRRSSAAIQRRVLRDLLARAAKTEIGREHGFGGLAEIDGDAEMLAAYRKAVPVRDWYGFQDRIRMMREEGRPDVLWPGLVRDFAQTSGTTAGDKFIPVSKEMFGSNYRASLDIFAHMLNRGISLERVLGGRCLFLGGSSDVKSNEHGVRTGDLSGLVTRLIRWPLTAIYSPGPDVALMDDWPRKIEAMAALTVDQDIRFISGMPSWGLVLMERVKELARERGRRAETLRDVWPNLQIFVHGGVKYAPFEARIARAYSGSAETDLPHRLELYPASEAFVAIQDRAGDSGMRLLTDNGVFFEFVPLERIGEESPEAFACDEVEKGQRYVVVLTTCAGLWRYVLGDVVEFDTVPAGPDGSGGDGPCRLRIVGRHRHFINAFGENIIVEHIENAVAKAASETGLTPGEFTAAPVYPEDGGRRAGLELVVELPEGTGGDRVATFARAFDEAVKAQNVDYTTKRTSDLGMGPPTVTPVLPGTFHRWMESVGKLGGQHKCPRCANHREIVEGVLDVAGQPAG